MIMADTASEYSATYFAQAGECNAEYELSLPVLVAKMIDISTHHANSLGIGNPSMADIGGGWVLTRLVVEMKRYPAVNEDYTLTTWVEGWNRHFSERSYAVYDTDGNVIGYARSVWMVLDMKTHESMGLSHLIPPEGMIAARKAPIDKIGRHRTVLPYGEQTEAGRNTVAATCPDRTHVFRYCDLDFYRHVNTVRYVELLLNQFTLSEMDSTMVSRMELCFMHEGPYGEPVEVRCASSGLDSEFTVMRADGLPIITASAIRIKRKS